MRTGVVTRVERVKSKDSTLADPASRLARATFRDVARKLGAAKFVRLPIAPRWFMRKSSVTWRGRATRPSRQRRTTATASKRRPAGASCPASAAPTQCRSRRPGSELGGMPIAGFDSDVLADGGAPRYPEHDSALPSRRRENDAGDSLSYRTDAMAQSESEQVARKPDHAEGRGLVLREKCKAAGVQDSDLVNPTVAASPERLYCLQWGWWPKRLRRWSIGSRIVIGRTLV